MIGRIRKFLQKRTRAKEQLRRVRSKVGVELVTAEKKEFVPRFSYVEEREEKTDESERVVLAEGFEDEEE